MNPEKENQEIPNGEENAAVVVDLGESDDTKLITPLEVTTETRDDKSGGEHEEHDDAAGEDDEIRPGVEITGKADFVKRLKREVHLKVEERAAHARTAEEAEDLRRENEQLRRTQRTEPPSTADIDAKVTAKQTELEAAIEAGDSKKQAALTTEILGLQSEKTARLTAPRRQATDEDAGRDRNRERARQKGPTKTGQAFVAANSWWNDPNKAVVRSAVVAIDQELMRKGSDPDSPAHYKRIAKQAKEMGLKVKISQPFGDEDDMGSDFDDDRPTRERRTAPQGNNGNSRGRVDTTVRDARAGKIAITEEDKATMREFKLDPANPGHIRAFAESRRDRILQEAGQ